MNKNGEIVAIGVVTYTNKEGTIKPLYIVWEDEETGKSEKYKIDKIVNCQEVIPGHFMWNVVVRNRVINMHYRDGKWYTVRGVHPK